MGDREQIYGLEILLRLAGESGGKERGEFPKLSCVQIRDSPVIHPALRPVEKIVTAPRT